MRLGDESLLLTFFHCPRERRIRRRAKAWKEDGASYCLLNETWKGPDNRESCLAAAKSTWSDFFPIKAEVGPAVSPPPDTGSMATWGGVRGQHRSEQTRGTKSSSVVRSR